MLRGMGGYFSNRWVAAADFLLGIVGVFLLIFGGAYLARAFGAAALIVCLLMLVIGFFDWRKQLVSAAERTARTEMERHFADLAAFATQMQLFLAQRDTPWRFGPVCDQFQEHFPQLVGLVNTWLAMVRAAATNQYWRPSPA